MDRPRAPQGLSAVSKGLNSLTLDQSSTMRTLHKKVRARNTVTAAWVQVGRAIRDSINLVLAPAPR